MLSPEIKKQLLQALHVSHASPHVQEKLVDSLEKLFEEVFMHVVLTHIDDNKRSEFLDILEQDTSGMRTMVYIKQHIPRFDELVKKQLQEEIKQITVE